MPRRINDQRIVLVEDDAAVTGALETYFSAHNRVRVFSNAEDTLKAEDELKETNIFILDYKLPGKNGVELFQHLRIHFPAAKYILITGEMSYDLLEANRLIGFDALILKPFDFTILEDNLAGLVDAR